MIRLIVALALWCPAMVWQFGMVPTAAIALPACAISLWIGQVAARKIEGLTGDVMGATTLCTEIIMLLSWVSVGALMPA